ncbi:MAG: hypothetical protein EXQ87_09240 [Alphaproteobacteria bacterium]|nr:hypothetical protein [Alphaproteobacteria bacterium]
MSYFNRKIHPCLEPLTAAGRAALLLGLALWAAPPVAAQNSDTQRIAAVVNDDAISVYDLRARLRMAIAAAALEDTPELRQRLAPQLLRSLIDEKLQLQEAKRLNQTASDREIQRTLASIEQNNRLAPGGLDSYLKSQDIQRETLLQQVTANIIWNKVVSRRVRQQGDVGEDEIDDFLQQLRGREGSTEYLVSEIFLAVDEQEQETNVRRTAERLIAQMQQGITFEALARQFSQSPSAPQGGDMGRVQEGQLEPRLDAAIKIMPRDSVSEPIRVDNGFYVLQVRERRKLDFSATEESIIALRRIFLPIAAGVSEDVAGSQMELAQTLSETVNGCDDMPRLATELGVSQPVDAGKLKIKDLPQQLRPVVASLKIGQASPPVRIGEGVLVMMVCERQEAASLLPSRDEVSRQLTQQRFDLMARRYMRDLRRAAFVDVRA